MIHKYALMHITATQYTPTRVFYSFMFVIKRRAHARNVLFVKMPIRTPIKDSKNSPEKKYSAHLFA